MAADDHGGMVFAGVEGGEHAIDQRAIELDIDEAVDRTVLQHLEAADRPPELLAQLDVVERDLERRSRKADELYRGAEHQDFLQLPGQLARFGPGRDHLLRRDMDLGEGEPARCRSIDIAFGRDRNAGRRARDDGQHRLRPGINCNEKGIRRAGIGDERNAAVERAGAVIIEDAGRVPAKPPGRRFGRRHDQA